MARTELNSRQIKDGGIKIEDVNVTTPGQALITKIHSGENISISYTGVDIGTGVVTINALVTGISNYKNLFI